MKVSFTPADPSGSSPIPIFAGGVDSPEVDGQMDWSAMIQLIEAFRGADAKTKGRGNRRGTWSVSKTWPAPRENFASVGAAEAFWLTHIATLLGKTGTITFQTESGVSFAWNDCTFETITPALMGLAVRMTYRLTGGQLNTAT